jgi:predicted nucleic acid-binding protein
MGASVHLVVDANVLVAELLRVRGLELLTNDSLSLFTTSQVVSETNHELRRRLDLLLRRGRVLPEEAAIILADAERLITTTLSVASQADYLDYLVGAARRMLRDRDDVPSMALALALDCGVWTNDQDFFGCGVPVWSTDVLLRHLDYLQEEGSSDGIYG